MAEQQKITIPDLPPASPDFDNYINQVLSGNVDPARLQASQGDGFVRTPDGRFADIFKNTGTNRPTDTAVIERRRITPEQAEVVTFVTNSVEERTAKLQATQGISLAQKTLTEIGSVEAISQAASLVGMDQRLTSELQALLSLKGKTSDPAVDNTLLRFFENGDDKPLFDLLESRGVALADVSDAGGVRTGETYLRDYVQTARQISLRSRFWKDIQSTPDANSSFRTLEEYAAYDETDRSLVLELRNEGLKARRDGLITEVFKRISTEESDYTTAAVYLAALGNVANELRDQGTVDILRIVANTAYQSEVNLTFGNLVKELTVDRTTIAAVTAKLQNVPIRPAIAGVDFFEKFQKANEQFLGITRALDKLAFERELTELKGRFLNDPDVQGLVEEVFNLPGETAEDDSLRQGLLDELALFVTVQRGLDPSRYRQLQEVAIDGLRAVRSGKSESIDLTATPERRNIEAVRNLVSRFQSSIMPLFESVRGGVDGEAMVDNYIAGGDKAARDLYVQRIATLREQRDLTDIEQAYLESVELLSIFNPHLIALAKEQPELTSLYLESYFQSLDKTTKDNLIEGMYIPAIQIGLGPSGLAAAGEINRSNPELASQVLYIDAEQAPGGPFGVAKGLAWELNSANSLGRTTNVLPDLTEAERAGVAVRSLGSPLVSYPGERKEGSDIRQGSINVTADYLLNPDNVSNKRYPTNVDLARVLQLQAAMLVDNVMLSSRVISARPANDDLPGNKIIEVAFATPQGEVVTTIRTDAIVLSSGLGEPNYGIELEGSRAEKILQGFNTGKDSFPELTDTIGAFDVLSNPEGEAVAPEGTIAIYGGGNSADVLIEYLGRQFESGNPALNGITKVYVVTNAELSRRPRYAQINDLKSRNGQPNFLELVQSRVTDVARDSNGKLELLNETGQPIIVGANGGSKPLKADHVIAASGFRPMLDEVFAPLLADGESIDRRARLDRITLPNNPGFSIADVLINDPNVVVVGTASRADFKNPNKLAQLPNEAREALLRNGAENAVAIGFRAPDTRAAVRLTFGNKTFANRTELQPAARQKEIDINEVVPDPIQLAVPLLPIEALPTTRRDVDASSETLTALLLGSLPKLKLTKDAQDIRPTSPEANVAYEFGITLNAGQNSFTLTPSQATPSSLSSVLQEAIGNGYFQSYVLKALRGRRSNKGLQVVLSFSSGKLRLRDAGPDAPANQRTYVETL